MDEANLSEEIGDEAQLLLDEEELMMSLQAADIGDWRQLFDQAELEQAFRSSMVVQGDKDTPVASSGAPQLTNLNKN